MRVWHALVPDRDDRGFVLVVVLAICLTLALVGVVVARLVRPEVREAAAMRAVAEAEAAADGGVALVLADRAVARSESGARPQFAAGSGPIACRFGATLLVIEVAGEAGKVPMNTSNAELLAALFAGLGADPSDARTFADRMIDWRDGDGIARPSGAEAGVYLAQSDGRTVPPRNAAFESAGEISQVLGLPPDLAAAAEPWLTPHGDALGIDPESVPRALVEILVRGVSRLTGFDSSAAGAFTNSLKLPAGFTARPTRPIEGVTVTAVLATGQRFVRNVVIETVTGRDQLRAWRQGTVSLSDEMLARLERSATACGG